MLKPMVVRENGWLLYAAALPGLWPSVAAELLAPLPGGCKLAYGGDAVLRVRAELPECVADPERKAAIEVGFVSAAARLGFGAAPAQRAAVLSSAVSLDLPALCREAGWPFEERAGGSLAVDLGVPGAYLTALVETHGEGVAAAVELAQLPDADGPCRDALVALLLRVNAAFRGVRAVLRGPRALLEAELPPSPSAAELAEALAALAVAARHCALEARLLASDDALATAFLERSGTSPPR